MSTDEKDRALKEYLAAASPVSRSYRDMGSPEPPPELDQTVLAEARRAGRARAYSRSRVRWNTWFVAATLAATIALSVSLVLEVTTFRPMYDEMITAPPTTLTGPETLLRPSPGDDSEALPHEEAVPLRARSPAPAETQPEDRALAPEPVSRPDARDSEEATVASQRSLSVIRKEGAAVAGQRADKVDKGNDAQPDTPAPGVPGEDEASRAGAKLEQYAAAPAKETPQPGTASGRLQTARTVDGLASYAPPDSEAVPGYPAPDVWLAGIRFLQARGETKRANDELEKFRAIYPDYRWPDSGD